MCRLNIKIVAILAMAVGSLSANWHPLKLMKAYNGRDFTLKNGVEYVEVKKVHVFEPYHSKAKKRVKKSRVLRLYREPLSSFSAKVRKDFKNLPLSAKKSKSFMHGGQGHLGGSEHWYYNGFMLDSNLKTWRLESKEDLIDMVKPIDTPAEAKLVMWVNGFAEDFLTYDNEYKAKYKKVGKNYIVKEHYKVTDTAYGDCGIYTYKSKVTRDGRVLNRRLIQKAPTKICGGE